MSKHQTKKIIRAEIERLNQEIDLRIIRGVSYRREARRHRFLMTQLARLNSSGFLGSVLFTMRQGAHI
ncbi:MAG: hypothetical protein KGI59_01855 [Patescibacteria group bacterium]|nr:hypothetical protein [Patescibacteria group bacterium]MDE2172573.1 hypothetical protein [Patescibacteria group bacterium]